MAGQVDATITHKTGEAFPESVLNTVAAVDGVRAVSGTLERSINLLADYFDGDPAALDRVSVVTLVGADPDALQRLKFNITEGRFESG
jgi:putative ABC transport system permease protein